MSAHTLTRENAESLVRDWFTKVDVLDVDGTMSLCDEKTLVTFGNQASVQGDAELREMFSGWYSFFDKMHHDIRDISFDSEHNTIFISSMVGYYLKAHHDVSPIVVPAMSVMRMGPASWEGPPKFVDFRVYFDVTPVTAMFTPGH